MSALTGALPRDTNGISSVVRPVLGGTDFVVPTEARMHLPLLISAVAPVANADTNGPTRDRCDDFYIGYTRAYVFSDVAGTLYLEESLDGAAWAAPSFTFPVVANTPLATLWMPLSTVQRYYRWRHHNGAAPATRFSFWGGQAHPGALPAGSLVQRVASIAPLGGGGTINAGAGIVFPTDGAMAIVGSVAADQAGNMIVDQSADGGANWDIPSSNGNVAVVAGTPQSFNYDVRAPLARVRYTNGGVAQAAFRLYAFTRK